MQKRTQTKCSRLLHAAGYEVKGMTGVHPVTVSNIFVGKKPWTEAVESALLALTNDPHLVSMIRSASVEARRKYLVEQMVELEAVAR